MREILKFLHRDYLQIVHFNSGKIPHTTARRHATNLLCCTTNAVYLQHGGVYYCIQSDVTVTLCIDLD